MSYSDDDASVVAVKSRLLDLLVGLKGNELNAIEQWISTQSYKKDLANKRAQQQSEKVLTNVGNALKKLIPFEAQMPSERIVPPTVGDQADCTSVNTCHIDEFLYDEDQVEKLVQKGKIVRHYCLDCKSHNIEHLTFISHSMSKQALQYIFKFLLPRDLVDKQVLDVGSRLGAVIYAGYYLTNASAIIGVEMNKECCEIQEKIIGEFSMNNNRIKVIHSDITEKSDIIQNSDVIVINVLDFFVDTEKHKQMWYFFKNSMKTGTFLVSNRCMASTLNSLDIFEEFVDWLSICKPYQPEHEILFDVEVCNDLYLYTVN